jgi:hypothetical protein
MINCNKALYDIHLILLRVQIRKLAYTKFISMILKRCRNNKLSFILLVFILIAPSVTSQVSSNTLGELKSDSTEVRLGQFILEMPFGAKLYKNDYDNGQDLLYRIKNFCKGKAIFIDIWATWCGHCLEAMPNNKRHYIETKNLPIEFIYICTDINTNIDNWITKISILRQPGIHIFVENKIINQMENILFNSSGPEEGGGFPLYLFIDKNGQFKTGAIPRNASTTTERLIESISK